MDAGLALAPDTFQIVLDSENEAKGGHRSHSHSPELCGEQAAVGRDPRGGGAAASPLSPHLSFSLGTAGPPVPEQGGRTRCQLSHETCLVLPHALHTRRMRSRLLVTQQEAAGGPAGPGVCSRVS